MKSCPACNRTYADDTLTFCLDDGALLSAPYDPQATLRIPATRNTDQPTEILPATPHADPYTSRQQTTARPSSPFNYQQEAVADASHQKRSSRTGIIVGGVIAILTIAVLLLGYVVWSGNQNTQSEASKRDANRQANSSAPTPTATPQSNLNVNADGATPKPLGDPHLPWLDGVWEGTAHQNTPK